MALLTYSDLQTAVATWLGRNDLTASIPDFITLFEAYANRTLRTRQMETSVDLSLSSGETTLPTDYLNWKRVTWSGDTGRELAYATPNYILAGFPTASQGTPQLFTIEGTSLYVRPVDDTSLSFLYWAKIPPLAATPPASTTNWLLTAHPDAYLFGSLVEAAAFVVDAEKAALWKLRRDEVCNEIQRLSNVTPSGSIKRYGWIV